MSDTDTFGPSSDSAKDLGFTVKPYCTTPAIAAGLAATVSAILDEGPIEGTKLEGTSQTSGTIFLLTSNVFLLI